MTKNPSERIRRNEFLKEDRLMRRDRVENNPAESKMKEEEGAESKERCATPLTTDVNSQRVFKKSSPNNKLTVYLSTRDLYSADSKIDRLYGVLCVDPEYLEDKKIYGQITLTFRYGREDEEVMGLKFCNEAVMCLAQLYPPHEKAADDTTPIQEALIKRLGPNAHPFSMTVTHLAPPSVQLVPAKEYNGAPIGTSYDIRAYIAERPDEKLHRRNTVRMGIRVLQRASRLRDLPRKTKDSDDDAQQIWVAEMEPPHVVVEKPFLLTDGKVELEASLDKAFYCHGESVGVTVAVRNNSRKTIRRIKVFIVQHVDVCMFSNGKFKNVVALANSKEECPLAPWTSLSRTYTLHPVKGATKNWIALEDSFNKSANVLASTVTCPSNNSEDRNVFAIYVSYYVKVKILASAMGGKLSVKLPFTLTHGANEPGISSITEQKPTLGDQGDESLKKSQLKKDVELQKTQIKDTNRVTNTHSTQSKSDQNAIQEENEILKCEEEAPI